MYHDLYTVITDRLTALGLNNVATGIGDVPPLPACQVWLGEDKFITDAPAVIRELTWALQVTVGHNDTDGAAQLQMHGYLDTIRDGFSDWRPGDCVGLQGAFSVPTLRIESYKDHGSTVYLAALLIRVFPQSFVKT